MSRLNHLQQLQVDVIREVAEDIDSLQMLSSIIRARHSNHDYAISASYQSSAQELYER